MLPPKIAKGPKRETRWRSAAHCNFVRGRACSNCGSTQAVEVAHVRIGSGAGLGQKPDDFRTVSLCKVCHVEQHTGERSFWERYERNATWSVETLIQSFCDASPKAAEIRRVKAERANG